MSGAIAFGEEERMERIRMALAEAGYPGALVWWTPDEGPTVDRDIPAEVTWRAFVVCGEPTVCLECFLANVAAGEAGGETIEVCEHLVAS